MRIILEVEPEDVDWDKHCYASIHKETVEAWGSPHYWEEVDFQITGRFGGRRIKFYDEDDEWEAIQFFINQKRMG